MLSLSIRRQSLKASAADTKAVGVIDWKVGWEIKLSSLIGSAVVFLPSFWINRVGRPVVAAAIKERLLVAAIDFGTTFSSYAYSFCHDFKEDPLRIVTNDWSNTHGVEIPLSRKTMLEDSQHKTMCAMDVFTAAVKALKDHLINTLLERGNTTETYINDIHWVLTVPAIWGDAAKQFMRESAINADIATGNLTLALESEATSLFCQYLLSRRVMTENGVEIKFIKTGSKYLVLDTGGGTIDISVHEVEANRKLKELHKAKVGDWGGAKINKTFEQLLADIVGPDVYEIIQFKYRDDYIELMRGIENMKRNISPTDTGKVNIRLPSSVIQTYFDMNKAHLKDKDKVELSSGKKISINIDGDKLKINANVIQGLFAETCDNIVAHVREVLANDRCEGTNIIMLVGELAESAMLREAIESNFLECKVVISPDAHLAVLKGAVIYGHKPESVVSRISKFTYGIEALKSYEPGIDPKEKRREIQGYVLCEGHFSKHAEIGKEYSPGESFGTHEYVPLEPGQRKMMVSLFRSTQRHPLYVDQADCTKVGDMIVELLDHEGGMDRPVVVKMIFGETELGIEAKEKNTGNVTTARYDFLS